MKKEEETEKEEEEAEVGEEVEEDDDEKKSRNRKKKEMEMRLFVEFLALLTANSIMDCLSVNFGHFFVVAPKEKKKIAQYFHSVYCVIYALSLCAFPHVVF